MRYFIGKDGKQFGPFEAQHVREQLSAGAYSPEDLVWREGMSGWAPLRTEFPALSAPPPVPPPGLTTTASPAQPASPYGAGFGTAPVAAQPIPGANTGLILGLVNLIAWFLPILGLPLSIWGLVASIKAHNRGAGGKAVAGIVLNSITLLLSLANAAIGAYLGATGQHPLLK